MKATETHFLKFLQKTGQFHIPIYQRTYSWTDKQCRQLWSDIIQAATNDSIKGHFLGSIVYVEKGLYQVSSIPQFLVIDGQQRLTTLSLLLAALGKQLEQTGGSQEISRKKIGNYYLFNSEEEGVKRHKLILTQSDKPTLINLLEDRDLPPNSSKRIIENYNFFLEQIHKSGIDLELLFHGIGKLIIVDIALDSNYDNPQLIFESLNSTGLALSQADLIRNFVLMRLELKEQEEIYNSFWYPMEQSFGHNDYVDYFNRFMRDYLTIRTGQIPNIGEVYADFKDYFADKNNSTREIMGDIYHNSKFFTKLAFEREDDKEVHQLLREINTLKVEVAYPFLMELFEDYSNNILSRNDLLAILSLVESYVFRRAICGIPTNSLNKTFAGLAKSIDKKNYLESIQASFALKDSYRRFPDDVEFQTQFIIKDVYNFRNTLYLLRRLENYDRKEPVDTQQYSIEHVMPQNPNLSSTWREDLGPNWATIHSKYLNTIGNLTLTGYNSELSDRPFLEKRDMKGGFADSPIRLNKSLANLEHWNENEIKKRAKELSELALKIWPAPHLSPEILEKYHKIDEEEDEEEDEDELPKKTWNDKLEEASPEIRAVVTNLIPKIENEFHCISQPYHRWYAFYVEEPKVSKTRFAVMTLSRKRSTMCFRINPNSFKDNDQIRIVRGFFFPTGTERRVYNQIDNIDQVFEYLKHSYVTTKELLLSKRR